MRMGLSFLKMLSPCSSDTKKNEFSLYFKLLNVFFSLFTLLLGFAYLVVVTLCLFPQQFRVSQPWDGIVSVAAPVPKLGGLPDLECSYLNWFSWGLRPSCSTLSFWRMEESLAA